MAANPAHDQSMHATDGRAVPARSPRVEIIAITNDDLLLEQIGQILDGESIVRHAENPAEAREIAPARQPCVLLLDARGHDNLASIVDDLQAPEGTRVVVIFAPAAAGDDVARAVRGSATFAVLAIPVVPAQAAAVLEGAREETLSRHALLTAPPPAPATAESESLSVAMLQATTSSDVNAVARERTVWTDATTSGNGGNPRTKVIVASLTLAGILAAAGSWYWLQEPAPAAGSAMTAGPVTAEPRAESPVENPQPEALQAGSVDELLDLARGAMRERHYTDPEGQNAFNYYRSVLAQEPGNGEAREGLERIAAVLEERVQSSVEQRRYDEATRTLAQLRTIRPDDAAIARYDAAIAEGRARLQAEVDRQQGDARAEQLAALVSLRIRQDKLLEPNNDSARHYLGQLRRLPGESQRRAAVATTELQQAYVDKFKGALAKSQRAEAERWKAEARALGVTAAEIAVLQRDATARATIVAESKQEISRIARLVQDRIADNRLLEPAGDSAVFHLNALRALDGSASAVGTSERALSGKLLEQGRNALTAQRLDAARAHAAAARQLGVNLDTVAALERDIAAAGTATTPAGTGPEPQLERTRYVAPEYPASALKQRVGGKVRVSMTVGANGKVRDATVVHSNPADVFDSAAVAAVRKWRFKPFGDKDSDLVTTAMVDIAFRPEDAKQ